MKEKSEKITWNECVQINIWYEDVIRWEWIKKGTKRKWWWSWWCWWCTAKQRREAKRRGKEMVIPFRPFFGFFRWCTCSNITILEPWEWNLNPWVFFRVLFSSNPSCVDGSCDLSHCVCVLNLRLLFVCSAFLCIASLILFHFFRVFLSCCSLLYLRFFILSPCLVLSFSLH